MSALRLPVAAFALFVLICSIACRESGDVTVRSLTFRGVTAVDESRLADALATRRSSKIPWGKKAFFDRSRFDADLKRVQAFYADRGFPDARVTGFDVTLNDAKDRVDLTVTIAEGEPVVVTAIDFSGFDVVPPEHLEALKKRLPLIVGQPRDRELVVSARDMAANELKDHGFPYAKVSPLEDDGSDGRHAVVTFAADPGKLAHVGPVEVVGEKSVAEGIILRELTFKPGDLFQRSAVQDSQRRLYGLDLFQFANVEPLNQDEQPEAVPIRVTVAEAKHQRVNLGVGWGTDERGRVDAEYRHVNFLGGARSAGVHARYSSLDRGVRADFTQPYLFRPHFGLGVEVQDWYTFTSAYQSVVTGTKLTLAHRGSARTAWAASIASEHDVSSISEDALNDASLRNDLIALGLDPTTGEQDGTLNALSFDVEHTTADSRLDPHRGYQLTVHAEQAGGIVSGTFNYTALMAEARHYLPVNDRVVFASRLQMGSIRAAEQDETNIPFSKRYLLGGATSLRGWGRYEVGPLSDSGQPIGGDSMLTLSGELRATLRSGVGAVLFLDVGNAWEDPTGFDLHDLKWSIGPGVRYVTPVGPLRFDVGYQLNPTPELVVNGSPQTRRFRIHFSIGQAF